MDALFIALQYLLPQQLLSRLAGRLAECRTSWVKNALIRAFIRRYRVDMTEALDPDPRHYPSFNAFFTRALKPGARPLAPGPDSVLCPADGRISEIGRIERGRLLQAKGQDYSLVQLVGSEELARPFRDGHFATLYLSPRDYHRVHMPLAGRLDHLLYVPGQLFSVNQTTADRVPALFARNERAVCLFETEVGPMAVILVGAMIVAGIETVWAGRIAPPPRQPVHTSYRRPPAPVQLGRGAELGRFYLGSTVVLLFPPDRVEWTGGITAGTPVRMGQQLGRHRRREALPAMEQG